MAKAIQETCASNLMSDEILAFFLPVTSLPTLISRYVYALHLNRLQLAKEA